MEIKQCISKVPAAMEFATLLEQMLKKIQESFKASQEHMKAQVNRLRSDALQYKIGDKVWLATDNLHLTHQSKKLTEWWLGLFPIVEMMGPNAIKLRFPRGMKIHNVVNISQVKSYKEQLPSQPVVQPSPVDITEDREEIHKVDYIVDSRLKGKWLEYLVHWTGCSDKDRTWEPLGHLDRAKDTIHEFHILHSNTPHWLSMTFTQFEKLFNPYMNYTKQQSPLINHLEVDS